MKSGAEKPMMSAWKRLIARSRESWVDPAKHRLEIVFEAYKDLREKYKLRWRYAWDRRHEMDRPERTAEEAEFLPAVLSVQDTPVGPMAKWGMRSIAAFVLIAVIASAIFEIDIVVSAPGVIVPSGHVKSIQTLEAGVVRRIAVFEGQRVKQGDVLVELFSPGIATDSARLQSERDAARQELERLRRLHEMLVGNGSQKGNEVVSLDSDWQVLLESNYREYLDKKSKIQAEVARRSAELISATEALKKTKESIPRLEIKAADYRELEAQGYVSRHGMLDQQQMLADARADTVILQSKVAEARAMLQESQHNLSVLVSEMQRTVLEQRRENQIKLNSAEQELAKFRDRDQLMVVRAPINGEVSHLMTYTIGGVVPAAQTLMSIVPESSALQVEATVANKDAGHVFAGQLAQIKIDSFPFVKYGLLSGRVIGITANAVESDDKKALVYKARVELPDNDVLKENFPYPLLAGMSTAVEIKIGKRRVIEYFLSPLLINVQEAAREP